MKRLFGFVMAVLMVLSMTCTPAMAANVDSYEPYGYSWYDDTNKVWHVQMYQYDAKAEAYRISDRVVLKGNLLYDMAGTLIVSDVATYSEDKPTVAFDADGRLYFVSTKGEVRRMESSLDTYYAVSATKGKYFTSDKESFADKVTGANTTKKLSNVSFSGSYKRHIDPVITDGYVKQYAVEGDAEKVGYDAYFNGNVVVTTYCRDSKVWSETFKLMITESSKGAKFVGYTAQYGVLIYDFKAAEVQLYKYEESYKKAHVLYSDVLVYYFNHDSRGFISGAVSDKKEISFDTDISFPGTSDGSGSSGGGSSTGSVTEVKNFQSKSMAYNGSEFLGTLSLKNKKLSWKGTELKNSNGSEEFGISVSLTPFWINGDDDLYWFDGTESHYIGSNVLRLKYDDEGRVTQYKQNGNWYSLW